MYNFSDINPKRAMTMSLDVVRHTVHVGQYRSALLHTIVRCFYDGKINTKRYAELAPRLGTTERGVRLLVNEAVRRGYLERRANDWFFAVGAKRWNMSKGFMHSKMIQVPRAAFTSYSTFKIYIRSVQIHMAEANASRLQRQSGKAPKIRRTALSLTYMANYTGLSTRQITTIKREAQRLGFVSFQRNYQILETGDKSKVPMWRANKESHQRIMRQPDGSFALCVDLTATCTPVLAVKRRKHDFSADEKKEIKSRFILFGNKDKRFGSKTLAEFKGELKLTQEDVDKKKSKSTPKSSKRRDPGVEISSIPLS